jgi:superfamily I DNA/RNA helicase
MNVLVAYPEVAIALTRRFPVVIVDEAQDTSAMQMRFLDELIKAGLREVMLVGDPHQAIYEWRQAEPRLFERKFGAWQHNSARLTENWRSTQSICDLGSRLAGLSARVVARNQEIAAVDHKPRLYAYASESDLPSVLQDFQEHCIVVGIEPSSVSVLTRSKEFVNAVVPGTVAQTRRLPWRENDAITRQVGHAKYLFDQRAFKEALQAMERAAYGHLIGRAGFRRDDLSRYAVSRGLGSWRGDLFRLLCALPPCVGTLSDWLREASSIIARSPPLTGASVGIKKDSPQNTYSDFTFQDVFGSREQPEETQHRIVGTIHSAKGRSLDAVFLVLKTKGATGGHYVKSLGSDLVESEELRVVYVAVTRARKALGIAVPHTTLDGWRRFLNPTCSVVS